MTSALAERLAVCVRREIDPAARAFARRLGEEAGACVVLFYGSNLRTGSREGVLDFYVLLPGPPERGLWPKVSYREWDNAGEALRAKIATMTLAKFGEAARGETIDTTIMARFVQPSALAWTRDETAASKAREALQAAAVTAGRLAAALGPQAGTEDAFWRALFRATYRAEFRVEKPGRESAILDANRAYFNGLLPAAWQAGGIAFAEGEEGVLVPDLAPDRQRALRGWWRKRRLLGKPLNIARLIRATATFDGAPHYAAWKIERHTGVAVEVTPWRERHPILAAPAVLASVWRGRRALQR